jgi:membrane-associated phospholipid phosphatase
MKFYQVHHFQAVTTMLGGMIAFPSFHVAWSVLLAYAALPWKKAFPFVAFWNALVIVSTVLLGWHYLVDVPAGLALAIVALAAGELTHRRLLRPDTVE